MTNESQQLESGFVSKTLHDWPKVSWLASPNCWVLHDKTDASCYGEKFIVLGERAWITKASVWVCYLWPPVRVISLRALQVGLDSKVNLGWCDKRSSFCHLPCVWTALLYHRKCASGVKRQGGLNVERWTAYGSPVRERVTKGCRVHPSNCRVSKELQLIKMMSQHGFFLFCLSFPVPTTT